MIVITTDRNNNNKKEYIITNGMVVNNELVWIKQLFSSEFIETVFLTFVGIEFVTFVDKLSIKFVISSHTITASLTIRFKHLLFSQLHVLRFQL